MTLDEVLNEALAWFEAYRRLGFAPEQIHFLMSTDGDVGMELKAQGLSFVGTCGSCTSTPKQVEEAWLKKADAWNNTMSEEERQKIWSRSFPARNSLELVTKMAEKGFSLRRPGGHNGWQRIQRS